MKTHFKIQDLLATLGLILGFSIALFLFNQTIFERSYDSFYEQSEQIYRLDSRIYPQAAEALISSNTTFSLYPLIKEIEDIGFISRVIASDHNAQYQGQNIALKIHAVDSDFSDIFSIKSIAGNIKEALNKPYHLVITASEAERLFGQQPAINQQLRIDNQQEVTVGAVIPDWPKNSGLTLQVLTSITTLYQVNDLLLTDWGNRNGAIYTRISITTSATQVNQQINQTFIELGPEQYSQVDQQGTTHRFYEFSLRPISNAHYYQGEFALEQVSSKHQRLQQIEQLAWLMIIIASINFSLFTLTKVMQQGKQLTLHKIIGAKTLDLYLLIARPIGLQASIAVLLGVGGSYLLYLIVQPYLSTTVEFVIADLQLIVYFLALPLVLTLIATLFPLLITSGRVPNDLLKISKLSLHVRLFFNSLIVLQFLFAVTLISFSVVINQQLSLISEQEQGFNSDNVHIIWNLGDTTSIQIDSLLDAYEQLPGVKQAAITGYVMGDDLSYNMSVKGIQSAAIKTFEMVDMGINSFHLLQIKPKAGRLFSKTQTTDQVSNNPSEPIKVVINEVARKALGFAYTEAAINQLFWQPYAGQGQWRQAQIIGVIDNFRFKSAYSDIPPAYFISDPNLSKQLLIRTEEAIDAQQRKAIRAVWQQQNPYQSFDLQPLTEFLSELYQHNEQQRWLVSINALFALVLAGIGLYTTTTILMLRRQREIAIRKAIGASQQEIIFLFMKGFSLPLIFSCLFSIPLSRYMIDQWLEQFSVQITNVSILLSFSILLVLTIALLSLYKQLRRFSRTSPSQLFMNNQR